jgi:hypothetical protein
MHDDSLGVRSSCGHSMTAINGSWHARLQPKRLLARQMLLLKLLGLLGSGS